MSEYDVTFTIDLLNGQGVPLKTRPGGVVIVALTALLPVLLTLGTLGFYLNNRVILTLKHREVAKNEASIATFSEAIKNRDVLLREKSIYTACVAEISASLKNYVQWSPVLVTVVENMPESVALTSLEVEVRTVKKDVPKKDGSNDTKQIEVPTRVMRVKVSGAPQYDCDAAVREFQKRLRASALLNPRLENITVSQDSQKVEGGEVFSYEITCMFKPGM